MDTNEVNDEKLPLVWAAIHEKLMYAVRHGVVQIGKKLTHSIYSIVYIFSNYTIFRKPNYVFSWDSRRLKLRFCLYRQ